MRNGAHGGDEGKQKLEEQPQGTQKTTQKIMKRSTRSKFSAADLKEAAKQGSLERVKEAWSSYLEGDVSEKYKVVIHLCALLSEHS